MGFLMNVKKKKKEEEVYALCVWGAQSLVHTRWHVMLKNVTGHVQ